MKEFNEEEIDTLVDLYSKKDLDTYSFKIFERARKLGNGKYDFIAEDFYYNTLAAYFSNVPSPYQPQNDIKHEYINMIYGDYITVKVLLEYAFESYNRTQIS